MTIHLIVNFSTYDNVSKNSSEEIDFDIGSLTISQPLLTFAAVMTLFTCITGILGNSLTVVALLRCPRVRNIPAVFVISLSIVDLLFCILVLPFSASEFLHHKWMYDNLLCIMHAYIGFGNVGASLISIAMITINRYMMIVHRKIYPHVYKPHWIAVMIALSWLLSYGLQVPTLLGVWGAFGYDDRMGHCTIVADSHGRSSKAFLSGIAFVFPCLVIIFCYAHIFIVVRRSGQRVRQSGQRRNELRMTKMVLAIFIAFLTCYMPLVTAKVGDRDYEYPGLHILGYLMLCVSASINPVIYVIMNEHYRQAYLTVLMCRPPAPLVPGMSIDSRQSEHKSRAAARGVTNLGCTEI